MLSLDYARMIARDWNTDDAASGFVGFVTRFVLPDDFAARYPVQPAGGRGIDELWVPAAELPELNAHIVGPIEVIEVHLGPRFAGAIDPVTKLPVEPAPRP